jgi:phosphate transport system substrate-binding protein
MVVPPRKVAILCLVTAWGGACVARGEDQGNPPIRIDGSSTVFPMAEAFAEEFQRALPNTPVTVGFSGTGGGFERLCRGDVDLANASRPITAEERALCEASGVAPMALTVAWDGLSVIAHPQSRFLTCLTVDELARIWRPGSRVRTWRDVRPTWPDEEIQLYAPGTDSGTFDYFTEKVVGRRGASRADFQASEDDNVLVLGVAGDPSSLGYVGLAYYRANQDRLRLVGVDAGGGCVTPSAETIDDGTYVPLSRPLFVYVSRAALGRDEVVAYLRFILREGAALVGPTGFHPLSPAEYEAERARFEELMSDVP